MNWDESLKLYEDLIHLFPHVERKGKTMPYTSMNGNMFSFIDKEGKMGLRLSAEDREEFISTHKSGLMEQHGRIMKEYVVVPAQLLSDTNTLSDYFKKSYSYVSGLKPKAKKSNSD